MRIRRYVLLGVTTGVLSRGVTAASLTSAAAKPKDLTVTTTATAINNFVDVGSVGPSPGDSYVFVEDVFDTANHKIGSAEGRCNLIDPGERASSAEAAADGESDPDVAARRRGEADVERGRAKAARTRAAEARRRLAEEGAS